MAEKRTIKARDIVNDIRAGLTDHQLMEKYRLSFKGLQSIFKKLEDVKAIKPSELYGRIPSYEDTVNVGSLRKLPRNYLGLSLTIYVAKNPANRGIVEDITEKGVGVRGIQVIQNQTETLVVDADDLVGIAPVMFEATCRWFKKNAAGKVSSGFEIISISDGDLQRLHQLIEQLALWSSE
jgi:hypothetical protein